MGDHGSKILLSIATCLFVSMFLNTRVVRANVPYTFIDSAVCKGAVCLDGTPPAYSLAPGSGSGANSWFIFLEGGAWCNSISNCIERVDAGNGWLGGSNRRKNESVYFTGMFSGNRTFNPDFYNWNRVYVAYCDGGSFSGDIEEVDPETNLHHRGARVFNAIMEELLAKGMDVADNVILSGASAGGLSTMLHCDSFRQQIVPHAKTVKCISDGGFFLHAKKLPGAKKREAYFRSVVELHQMEKSIPASCTSKMNPGLCLFPEYLVEDMQTPLLILETAFDTYQLRDTITPYIGNGAPEWHDCLYEDIVHCNSTQIKIMQKFQKTFINTLENLKSSTSRGMFVETCVIHTGHIHLKEYSTCSSVFNTILENKSVAQAIGDWYFDRANIHYIDTNTVPRNCSLPRNNPDIINSYAYNKECMKFILDDKV